MQLWNLTMNLQICTVCDVLLYSCICFLFYVCWKLNNMFFIIFNLVIVITLKMVLSDPQKYS